MSKKKIIKNPFGPEDYLINFGSDLDDLFCVRGVGSLYITSSRCSLRASSFKYMGGRTTGMRICLKRK